MASWTKTFVFLSWTILCYELCVFTQPSVGTSCKRSADFRIYENKSLKVAAMESLSFQNATFEHMLMCIGDCTGRDLCQAAIWTEEGKRCEFGTK